MPRIKKSETKEEKVFTKNSHYVKIEKTGDVDKDLQLLFKNIYNELVYRIEKQIFENQTKSPALSFNEQCFLRLYFAFLQNNQSIESCSSFINRFLSDYSLSYDVAIRNLADFSLACYHELWFQDYMKDFINSYYTFIIVPKKESEYTNNEVPNIELIKKYKTDRCRPYAVHFNEFTLYMCDSNIVSPLQRVKIVKNIEIP